MNIALKQHEMTGGLLLIEDPQERLAAVVDRARTRAPLSPSERNDANRVEGCVSAVWVVAEVREGLCQFRGDADSPVVRGLVALLCDLYSGAPPAEVAALEADILDQSGLARSLSPTRVNGLRSVREKIREFARKQP